MNTNSHKSFVPPLWIVTIVALAVALWLVYELKEMVVLLVVGYCVAYVVDPVLAVLEQRNISRSFGFIFVSFGVVVGLVVVLLTAMPTISSEYHDLSQNLPVYVDTMKSKVQESWQDMNRYLPGTIGAKKEVTEYVPSVDSNTVQRVVSALANALLRGYSLTLTIVNLVLLPFIAFYFAVDFRAINRGFLSIFRPEDRQGVAATLSEINLYVSAYVRGQIAIAFLLFLLYAAGLGIIGIKLWFLVAVIAGFGSLVPYLGGLVGIVLGSIMAVVTFGDFTHVIYVLMVFGVVSFIEGFIIAPKILGQSVGLSPLAIIVALFAGGTLFGLLGVFLAVPGAAALKVLWRRFHSGLLDIPGPHPELPA